MLLLKWVTYRDDRQALALQLAELEHRNEELRSEVVQLRDDARTRRQQEHEQRKSGAHRGCAVCGGSLLPVALFAGRDLRTPIPLLLSTSRFGNPGGGFTRAAPLKSMACSSCGFVHNFIDIVAPEPEAAPVADDVSRTDHLVDDTDYDD